MAQNLRKDHVSICAEKKFFSIFNSKKGTTEKQKLRPCLVIFLENSPTRNYVRNTVVYFDSKIDSFHITNTVCNIMHHQIDRW